ncbi:shikimate kinase [Malonomonas rubra DSM 5091]|uniref:Shikimate kinase n=1 Tax=Malonomonas rubra DSM 5091 TaxID=1122189 RepID=A0A1M6MLN9_MALRU|nr:shikimate kinase [Malonomonas rubra]SHJ84388.1 shikimate kinase [Malonomonas rubra DSM 5091]
MNIVLIGYRGTGKSHVGQLLGKKFGRKVVSMDEEIVKTAGMPIPQIVEKFGWDRFREMETEEARKLAGHDQLIIDCGGGIIERTENTEILQQNGNVFWLRASVESIVARIKDGTQRPALVEGKTFTEEVAEVLQRRTPLYRAAAHHEIDTDNRTPEQVAKAIISLL